MKTPTLHHALQTKLGSYAGEHLVTTLRYQDQYGNSVEKPLLDAIAFHVLVLQKLDDRLRHCQSLRCHIPSTSR